MFSLALHALVLALAAPASPLVARTNPVTIPLARHLNMTGAANVVANDQARARALRSGSFSEDLTVPDTNTLVAYTAQVRVDGTCAYENC